MNGRSCGGLQRTLQDSGDGLDKQLEGRWESTDDETHEESHRLVEHHPVGPRLVQLDDAPLFERPTAAVLLARADEQAQGLTRGYGRICAESRGVAW